MALQGDIKSIALSDVLRLLSGAGKTGRIRLTGDRGEGQLWLRDGGIVRGDASAAPHAEEPVDVLFELMRFQHGAFRYDDESVTDGGHQPVEIDGLLTDAGAMLTEWRTIEEVVPSPDARVRFTPELDRDQVVVSGDEWRVLGAVSGECLVHELGDRLAMTELAVARVVCDLVGSGLILVGEVATPAAVEIDDRHHPLAEPDTTSDDAEQPTLTVSSTAEPSTNGLHAVRDEAGTAEVAFLDFSSHDERPTADEPAAATHLPEPLPVGGGTAFELGTADDVSSVNAISSADDDVRPDDDAQPEAHGDDDGSFGNDRWSELDPMTEKADRPAALADFLGTSVAFADPEAGAEPEPGAEAVAVPDHADDQGWVLDHADDQGWWDASDGGEPAATASASSDSDPRPDELVGASPGDDGRNGDVSGTAQTAHFGQPEGLGSFHSDGPGTYGQLDSFGLAESPAEPSAVPDSPTFDRLQGLDQPASFGEPTGLEGLSDFEQPSSSGRSSSSDLPSSSGGSTAFEEPQIGTELPTFADSYGSPQPQTFLDHPGSEHPQSFGADAPSVPSSALPDEVDEPATRSSLVRFLSSVRHD